MKKLIILFVVFLMLVFCNSTASQAVTIGFDPISQEVLEGMPVDVELGISGLGDGEAPSLSVFDLDIGFDPAILEFNSVSFGDPDPLIGDQLDLLIGSITLFTDSTSGEVNLCELSFEFPNDLNTLQVGEFTLATLTFDTLAVGTSPLDIISINALGDAIGDPLPADLISGSINVVPEPATLLLVGSGLAGLGFLRKKKNQSG